MPSTTSTAAIQAMLSPQEVARRVGVSTRTIYAWRKEGRMPEPRRMSERVLRWDAEQIDQWLASR